jgi:hypothetical protein
MSGQPLAGGDEVSKLMQFLNAQPQLIVCGRLGIQPLADVRRRELLSGVNLFDALESVARLQGRWDVAYTTAQRPHSVEASSRERHRGGVSTGPQAGGHASRFTRVSSGHGSAAA